MKPIEWFTRSFDCRIPTEALPCIVERLAGTPARLEEKIAALPPALLLRQPAEGRWTIQEQAGHLLDLEWLWFARIADFTNGAEVLTPADLTNRLTFESEHNLRPIGEILAGFRAARKRAVEAMWAMPPQAFEHTALHPRLRTPMRFADFAFFVAEHDDHHLATMSWLAAR
jgi:uncharacterized damage-inducible protein DinB